MNILLFEIKKIFSSKIVVFSVILFILLDITKVFMLYQDDILTDPLVPGRNKVINEISGSITNEKFEFVLSNKKRLDELIESRSYSTQFKEDTYSGYEFGDCTVFNEVYTSLSYAYHYKDNVNGVKAKAAQNISLYPKNSYDARYSQKILDKYNERQVGKFYDTTGFEAYYRYNFSSLLILLLSVLIFSSVFARETEINMNVLILSTCKGKAAITKAKLTACFIISILITLLFSLIDYIAFSLTYGLNGASNPLYSLPSFMYTTFSSSINNFVLLCLLLKIIGCLFFSSIIMFVSTKFSSTLKSFTLSLILVLISLCCNDFLPGKMFHKLNPVFMLTPNELFNTFNQINFFGYPVDAFSILIGAVVIFTVIFTFLIYKYTTKNVFYSFKNNKGVKI